MGHGNLQWLKRKRITAKTPRRQESKKARKQGSKKVRKQETKVFDFLGALGVLAVRFYALKS
jgi:hypothetical protein